MKEWAVWCTEYPEDGSFIETAWTEKGAVRKFRQGTGERAPRTDLTPLSAAEMTPELMAQREQEDA